GFGVFRRNRVALATTVLAIGAVFAISPLQAVVLPVIFERLDQPALLGLTMCVFAVGLIGGSLLYGALRLPRRAVLVAARLSSLAGVGAFAVAPVPAAIIPAAALVGLGYGLLAPMVQV